MTRNYREQVAARSAEAARVHFEFVHPKAQRVSIVGSFNGWSPSATPMAPAGNGRWRRELWLRPGQHEYLVVVDGKWLFDPMAADYVPNVFGGMNVVIHVQSPAKCTARRTSTTLPSFGVSGTNKGKASARQVQCHA